MATTLFIGLVTHPRTRFPESRSELGLAARVAGHLAALGVDCEVVVHDEDRFSEGTLPLTRREVLASIDAELTLERRWRRYVDPGRSSVVLSGLMTLRRLYRRVKLAPPWQRDAAATDAGARMLRRLVNIELAHLALLHEAHERGADWALIVEDDAHAEDPETFAADLAVFLQERTGEAQPAYVNISKSFSQERLSIASHLTTVGRWNESVHTMSSDIPLTNTVCAILYRGSFLEPLLTGLDAIPIGPVLPIDWKLNAALLALHETGRLGPGDCWFLEPAPILQGSMHAPTTHPGTE